MARVEGTNGRMAGLQKFYRRDGTSTSRRPDRKPQNTVHAEVVLTTGQVAKMCKVTPRLVTIWFDEGRLEGFRIPHSSERRIYRSSLVKFMRTHGISVSFLEAEPTFRVVLVGVVGDLLEHLRDKTKFCTFPIVFTPIPDPQTASGMIKSADPDAMLCDLSVGVNDCRMLTKCVHMRLGRIPAVALVADDQCVDHPDDFHRLVPYSARFSETLSEILSIGHKKMSPM